MIPDRSANDREIGTLGDWTVALQTLRRDLGALEAPEGNVEELVRALKLRQLPAEAHTPRIYTWRLALAGLAACLVVVLGVASYWPGLFTSSPPDAVSPLPQAGQAVSIVTNTAPLHFRVLPGAPPVMEGGYGVMRVRLPAWSEDRRTGTVSAVWLETEVLVGSDGIARAIRSDQTGSLVPAAWH
jgi:hypothetical protein